MRIIKSVLLTLIAIAFIGYSCKKEPVESKLFVEQYLVGRWYINSYVAIELTNKDTIKKDTSYQVVAGDTTRRWVNYTNTRKFVKGTDTVGFTVDEKAENITFNTRPDSTWFIPYIRTKYFKLVHTRTETVGANVKRYVLEQEFRKQ